VPVVLVDRLSRLLRRHLLSRARMLLEVEVVKHPVSSSLKENASSGTTAGFRMTLEVEVAAALLGRIDSSGFSISGE